MMQHLLAAGGLFDPIKNGVNWLTQPQYFLTLSFIVFILMFALYKVWTKPIVFGVIFVASW